MIGSGHQWKCVATNAVDGVTTSQESQVSFAVGMFEQINISIFICSLQLAKFLQYCKATFFKISSNLKLILFVWQKYNLKASNFNYMENKTKG